MPPVVAQTTVYLGSSSSKGLGHPQGLRWQPRPQTFTRTSSFTTAWGSRPWIPPWPPRAARTIGVFLGGPVQKMTCSSSQTSVTAQNLCVSLGQTPTKHFPRRGFEQEPLWWHSQLSVSPFKSICICTIWSLPRRGFVPLLLSQGRTQMPSLGCTHPLPSQLLSPLFCAALELLTHFSSFLLLSLLFLSADPNRSNEQ